MGQREGSAGVPGVVGKNGPQQGNAAAGDPCEGEGAPDPGVHLQQMGMAFAIQMPQGGALEFTKDLAAQYCALYDARFYWSVVHPQSGQVIARMTPGQMHSYRAGQ